MSDREKIIAWRTKIFNRLCHPDFGPITPETIRQKFGKCVCDSKREIPSPCNDCVEHFLWKRGERINTQCELKLTTVDKAHTKQVTELKRQLADHDASAITTLRKNITDNEAEILSLQTKIIGKDKALDDLRTEYNDRLAEGIADQDIINSLKSDLEKEKQNSQVYYNKSMVLIGHITKVSGENIPDDVRKAMASFNKTKLAKTYHLDRLLIANKSIQTEVSQSSSSPGAQQIIAEVSNAIDQSLTSDSTMNKLAEHMVKADFLNLLKKFLLSKELSNSQTNQFKELFVRDLAIKTRDWFTNRRYYNEVKERFFVRCIEGKIAELENSQCHFAQFKCDKTGEIFGTIVVESNLESTARFKDNCVRDPTDEVLAFNQQKRDDNKRKKDEKAQAKSSKNSKRRKSQDGDNASGDKSG